MRDNFSVETKDALAKRVSYRCSFPDCSVITIGPSHKSNRDVTNLGEAAHIYAASEGGPRYDPEMTPEDRRAIENGIWMCRHHARLIDADYVNYSADTLKQWKVIAEEQSSKALTEVTKNVEQHTTFVSVGPDIIFNGKWKSVSDNGREWKFEVMGFIHGDINDLKEFSIKTYSHFDYLIIETEGVGRTLQKNIEWKWINGGYEITIFVNEQTKRVNPEGFSDIALDDEGDLNITNGDFGRTQGVNCAASYLTRALSYRFGDLGYAPMIGSFFSDYYWQLKDNIPLLNRLIKIELTRLSFIPVDEKGEAPLNFVNRVVKATVLSTEIVKNRVPLRVHLEWGNGQVWQGDIKIFIHNRSVR